MIRVAFLTTDSREHYRDYESSAPYFGSAPAALLEGLANTEGLEVHVISCLQRNLPAPEMLADHIWYHGLHVPNWGWLKTGYQGCVRAVRSRLKKIQPDLVHGQGTERDCALNACFSGFPNLITIHGNMRRVARVNRARPFSYNWIMARLEGWAVKRTHGVLCITHYTQKLVEHETRRTWVVPNAVDPGCFQIQAGPSPRPTLLCAGTICAHKNQNRLIQELDPLASSAGFDLKLFGGIESQSEYSRQFLELVKSRDWCHYEGFADRERLGKELAQATLLVLPSLEDNCPMVVLEAMATGLPVVAVNVGGVADLVDSDVTGLILKQGDWEGFRSALKSLLTDDARRSTMGTASRKRAEKMFHPQVVAARHLEVYQDLLNMGLRSDSQLPS